MGTSRRTTIPRLQLDITQEMIDTAVPRDSGHCMIADAVKAAYPSATRISVDIQSIRFSDPLTDKRYVYLTPRTGQVALLEFDRGIHPVPFGLRPTGIQVVPIHHDHRDGTRTKVQKSALRPPSQAGGHGSVPEKHGGITPPMSALATGPRIPKNRRRAFGLRSLEY